MVYDILIEKKTGADTERLFLSRLLSLKGVGGTISVVSTLLRIGGIGAEQAEALASELAVDGTVSVTLSDACDRRKESRIALSRRNGAFCPMADVAYKILMLKFPRISAAMKIKEYTLFTVENNLDTEIVRALTDSITALGRYRVVTDEELSALDDKAFEGNGPVVKRGQSSIAPGENPDLSEPFSTVSSRMVMNAYANRTYEDMKNAASLTVRSGERTVYLDADYSELKEQLRRIDLAMEIDDASAAQSYFLSESREPTEMELRIISRCRSERWSHPDLSTTVRITSCDDPTVESAIRAYDSECVELDWDQWERSTLADLIFQPIERLYKANAVRDKDVTPVRLKGERNGLRIRTDDGEKICRLRIQN